MRSRLYAVLCALTLCVTLATPAIALANTSHVAMRPHPAVGPPLGYYEQEAHYCEQHPQWMRSSTAVQNTCQNDITLSLEKITMPSLLAKCLIGVGVGTFGTVVGGLISKGAARDITGATIGGGASACLGVIAGTS